MRTFVCKRQILTLTKCLLFMSLVGMAFSCQREIKSDFTPEAYAQKVYDTDFKESDMQTVLESHLGKKVMLVFWASWCADCIKSLPAIKEFQQENPEIQFVLLSVDENREDWETGIARHMDKFGIKGEQYFFNTGWTKNSNNDFLDFAGVDWIPRYMLINERGGIDVFYTKKIDSREIRENL